MADHASFIRAITARPRDMLPRLIYTDWLDEHGDPRGEFIRLQMELETTKPCSHPEHVADKVAFDRLVCRYCRLRRREREVLESRQCGTSTGQPSTNTRAAARYVWAGPVAQLDDPNGQGWRLSPWDRVSG